MIEPECDCGSDEFTQTSNGNIDPDMITEYWTCQGCKRVYQAEYSLIMWSYSDGGPEDD